MHAPIGSLITASENIMQKISPKIIPVHLAQTGN